VAECAGFEKIPTPPDQTMPDSSITPTLADEDVDAT